MKVLAIDDSRTVRLFVEMTLREAGYEVETIADLAEYTPCEDAPPDLVLVDVNMNEFLGTDLVAHIRQNWPGAPRVLLYSELPESELQQRADNCGADGYICKSDGYDGLVESVRRSAELV